MHRSDRLRSLRPLTPSTVYAALFRTNSFNSLLTLSSFNCIMGLDMFKSPFECLCSYFILPEFFEHVYLFACFSICEKYYTLSKNRVQITCTEASAHFRSGDPGTLPLKSDCRFKRHIYTCSGYGFFFTEYEKFVTLYGIMKPQSLCGLKRIIRKCNQRVPQQIRFLLIGKICRSGELIC